MQSGRRFGRAILIAATLTASQSLAAPVLYPPTARGAATDRRFGEAVPDPYRWLEGDVRSDPKVRAWIDAQAATTAAYLATLPGRAALRERLRRGWDVARTSVPIRRGSLYFYTRNTGLQNQAPLYVQNGISGAPRRLLDPNRWSRDGATALAEWTPSPDGGKLLYSVQEGGSDWRTIKVLDVSSAKLLPDAISWSRIAPPVWAGDGKSFFYERFPAPKPGASHRTASRDDRIYRHRLGTPVTADRPVFATPDHPTWLHTFEVTADGHWLVVFSSSSILRYQVSLLDLTIADARPRTLFAGLENDWRLAGAKGDTLYFVTDQRAPRRRIVAIEARAAHPTIREIVAQDRYPLRDARLIGDRLVAAYVVDAKSEARLFTLEGQPAGALKLPGAGTLGDYAGSSFVGGDGEGFFTFTSITRPTTVYRFDVETGETKPFLPPTLNFDPEAYSIEQRFYPGKDGTRIPLFLVRRKDIALDRPRPTLLYAYGGFGLSATPGFLGFRPADLAWIDMGGVYAQAAIRGGGEYGNAWHDAGRGAGKQTVFDDFAAAGDYLVAQKLSTPNQLAIEGGSNGGLLIGASINQRPELFAAAVARVGALDMLRFDRFGAGRYWIDEYGDPNRAADWKVLRAYSPYHNVRAGVDYPAVLVMTADTDDRVVPAHSFKFAAALQHASVGDKPHLLRIETRAGHGAGKPTAKSIDEAVDQLSFLARWTGLALTDTQRDSGR